MTDISTVDASTITISQPHSSRLVEKADIDWANLGFSYIKTDLRYIAHWKDGAWDAGQLTEDNVLHIAEGSTAVHYGQQCFEGMKAYECADGSVNLFRPDMNAARMQRSCDRLLMPQVPTDMFIGACKQVWPPTCASCRPPAREEPSTCALT